MAELGLVVSLPLPPQHSGVPGFRFILNSWGNPCADGPCDEAAGLDDGTWSQSLVVPACPLWERAVTSRHRPVHRDLHTLSVSEGKGSWRGHPATLGSLPFLPVAWQENPSRPSRKCPVCRGELWTRPNAVLAGICQCECPWDGRRALVPSAQ